MHQNEDHTDQKSQMKNYIFCNCLYAYFGSLMFNFVQKILLQFCAFLLCILPDLTVVRKCDFMMQFKF